MLPRRKNTREIPTRRFGSICTPRFTTVPVQIFMAGLWAENFPASATRNWINSSLLPARPASELAGCAYICFGLRFDNLVRQGAIISSAPSRRKTVAQPPEESKTEILPDPELNPLLNPLLASHMGEWAEVYFTSPPEKRAAAVTELLRELANKPNVEVPSQVLISENLNPEYVYHESHSPAEERPAANSFPANESPVVSCRYCGHENSDPQRFCGMCGMPLTSQPDTLPEQAAEQAEKFKDRSPEGYEPQAHDSSYEFDSADVSEPVVESA